MRIGLIDAELFWEHRANGRRYGNSKADIYPNLALMKLSAWHKQQGDDVEWYTGFDWYDRVYVSKVFSFTPTSLDVIQASEVVYGGSGFCIQLVDGREQWILPSTRPVYDELLHQTRTFSIVLPYEVEHMMPDYSIYPTFKDTAMGFLSRGCPRKCSFCHVDRKEGAAHKVADLSEWWSGQKNIFLCDPNILAARQCKSLLQQLADSKAWVDFNQGLDARLLTPWKVDLIGNTKVKNVHFAWDDYKQKDFVLKGLRLFADSPIGQKLFRSHAAIVYCLTNFDTTPEQDLERVYTLRDMGYEPYIMVYDKQNAPPFYKSLQRWVNMRAIFHRIPRFEDYNKELAKE